VIATERDDVREILGGDEGGRILATIDTPVDRREVRTSGVFDLLRNVPVDEAVVFPSCVCQRLMRIHERLYRWKLLCLLSHAILSLRIHLCVVCVRKSFVLVAVAVPR
jgi:hypothetical protein